MKRGYKEEINWKEISQDKIQMFKRKPVKFSSFFYLLILNIATVAAFAIIFTSYQQQHPYSLDEIASLTDSLAYQWYNETTNQDLSVSIQDQTTTQSSTETEQVLEIEETSEETTQEISETTETTESETSVQEEVVEESTSEQETQMSEEETTIETTIEETTQTTTATTTTATTATTVTTTAAPLSTSLAADTLVYVTSSGSKFHYITCSYLSSSCISLTYSRALSKGYSPCSRCFPNG